MLNKVMNFLRDEEGASAVEYGLIVGLIAAVVIVILTSMGTELKSIFNKTSDALGSAARHAGK